VLRCLHAEEVCTVDVYAPKLLHTVVWVVYSVYILAEASRCDKTINLAMFFDDVGERLGDRVWAGNIGVVGGD